MAPHDGGRAEHGRHPHRDRGEHGGPREGNGGRGGARSGVVIVASTSAAAGESAELTGPKIQRWLQDRGFACEPPVVVPDGEPVGIALRGALGMEPNVVIVTGGTGVSPSDLTPEFVAPHLDCELPGLIEELRRRGAETLPTALLTRGVAGFSGTAFVITLPGSPGGVNDGLDILDPVLDHLLDQRAGVPREP